MQRWQIGDVCITRVIETEDTSMGAAAHAAGSHARRTCCRSAGCARISSTRRATSSAASIRCWCCPRASASSSTPASATTSRASCRMWNKRQGAFLEHIAEAGFPRESVDFVVCTHLHPDHVGWNTMLVDDRWVPTFPNARYIFSARDWEWLDKAPVTTLGDYAGDSVRPVIAAGLADLVAPDYRFTDEVWLESTPGHSPGHVSVRIASAGPARGGHRRPDAPPLPARAAALVQPVRLQPRAGPRHATLIHRALQRRRRCWSSAPTSQRPPPATSCRDGEVWRLKH